MEKRFFRPSIQAKTKAKQSDTRLRHAHTPHSQQQKVNAAHVNGQTAQTKTTRFYSTNGTHTSCYVHTRPRQIKDNTKKMVAADAHLRSRIKHRSIIRSMASNVRLFTVGARQSSASAVLPHGLVSGFVLFIMINLVYHALNV